LDAFGVAHSAPVAKSIPQPKINAPRQYNRKDKLDAGLADGRILHQRLSASSIAMFM